MRTGLAIQPAAACPILPAALGALAIVVAACSAQESKPGTPADLKGEKVMELKVTSTAFKEGEYIPKRHTGEGPDLSPSIKWSDPPQGTKSIALICDDPDAPVGTWVHWVIYAIKPDVRELPEGVPTQETLPSGAKQGLNDFKKIGYGGPMPPRGSDHRYYFRVYALDVELTLGPRPTKKDLVNAMKGHILAEGQLMGRYKR